MTAYDILLFCCLLYSDPFLMHMYMHHSFLVALFTYGQYFTFFSLSSPSLSLPLSTSSPFPSPANYSSPLWDWNLFSSTHSTRVGFDAVPIINQSRMKIVGAQLEMLDWLIYHLFRIKLVLYP